MSKPGKSRALRNHKVGRKSVNTAVLPVAVDASPDAGKALIPITLADGPNKKKKVVPIAVRRSSGEVVIPGVVNGRGRRKRSVSIRVAVKRPAKKHDVHAAHQEEMPAPQKDPITNMLVSGSQIGGNALQLSMHFGKSALDVIEHWSRFLLNSGARIVNKAEDGIEPAIRAIEPSRRRRPILEAKARVPAARRSRELRIAA